MTSLFASAPAIAPETSFTRFDLIPSESVVVGYVVDGRKGVFASPSNPKKRWFSENSQMIPASSGVGNLENLFI